MCLQFAREDKFFTANETTSNRRREVFLGMVIAIFYLNSGNAWEENCGGGEMPGEGDRTFGDLGDSGGVECLGRI